MLEPTFTLEQTALEVQSAIKKALNPDKTLTKSGELGDAKVIGDILLNLKDRLSKLEQDGSSSAKIGEVVLLAANWTGSENLYSQVVYIDGVTQNSQVDLTPSVQQLAIFYEKDIAFVTENEGGVVTVYAIGQKPLLDYTIQVTITEVKANEKIIGVTVGTTTDPKRVAEKMETDETLLVDGGVLRVNTASEVGDNTLPITAAAVNATVGNIEVLLESI